MQGCFSFVVTMFVVFYTPVMAWPEKSVDSSVDYSGYMKMVERCIKTDWHPPHVKKQTRAVVFFKIKKNGEIVDAKIKNPSIYKQIDQSVLTAVNSASPLPPPPGSQEVSIQFTFDYNVIKPPASLNKMVNKAFNAGSSEILGFLAGFLIVLVIFAFIIYKLATLGRPPRE
jgi:TonB family protein